MSSLFALGVVGRAAGSSGSGPNSYEGLDLTAEGAYHPEELHDGTWANSTCSAGTFRDFYVDTSGENAHDNLFVELVHVPNDHAKKVVRLQSLALMLFYKEIPSDRSTEQIQASSPDGVYSLAINANELKEGRWFVSVRCDDLTDASFGVVAKFESAELHEGEPHPYFICPQETLYHYLNVSRDAIHHHDNNVRFSLCIPDDSQAELTITTKVRL